MTTVLKNGLRARDRLLGLPARVEIKRGTALEAVRMARWNVMLVELLRPVEKRRIGGVFRREIGQEKAQDMSPGLPVELLKQRLDGLLRGLVRGERGPVVIAVVPGVPRVTQIPFGLSEPIRRTLRHVPSLPPPFVKSGYYIPGWPGRAPEAFTAESAMEVTLDTMRVFCGNRSSRWRSSSPTPSAPDSRP